MSDAMSSRGNPALPRGARFARPGGVLCRIEVTRDPSGVVVKLAGHLTGAHVPDLLAACAERPSHSRVVLDEMLSADVIGLDALRRVEDHGAELEGLLEYLRFELDALRRKGV